MSNRQPSAARRPLTAGIVICSLLGSFILIAGIIGGRNVLRQVWQGAASKPKHGDFDYLERIIDNADSLASQFTDDPAQAFGNFERLAEDVIREQEKRAGTLSGEAKIVAEAGNVVGRLLIQSALDENALLMRFGEAGGIDPVTLTTSMAFRYRRQLLEDVVEQMDERDEFIRSLPDRFKNRLRSRGIASPSLEQYTASYLRGVQVDLLLEMRKVTRAAINDFKAVLDLLEQHHDEWTINGSGSIRFVDARPGLAEHYTQLVAAIESADQRANVLFEQHSANARRMLGEFRDRQ